MTCGRLPQQTSIDVIQWAKENLKDALTRRVLRLIHFESFPEDKAFAVFPWAKDNFSPEEFTSFIPHLEVSLNIALVVWESKNLNEADFAKMTRTLSQAYMANLLRSGQVEQN